VDVECEVIMINVLLHLAALNLDGSRLHHLGQVAIWVLSHFIDIPGASNKLCFSHRAILDDHAVWYLAGVAVGPVVVDVDFISSVLPEADILHPSFLLAGGVSAFTVIHVEVYLAILTSLIVILYNFPSGNDLDIDIQVRSALPGQ